MSAIIELYEDPENVQQAASWVGDQHLNVFRLVDQNGSSVDITTGTLGVTYTDISSGASYSFGAGTATITKELAREGLISILNPAAYPTSGNIRLTVSFTVSSVVRRFGPVVIQVLAP
jgi:hypothetical protein